MAHIFKRYNRNTGEKGCFVITHNEMETFSDFPDEVRDKYLIGVYYASARWINGVDRKPYQDFCMGNESLVTFNLDEPFRIELTARAFSPRYFHQDIDVKKHWDIINVSRNHKIKCLRSFLDAIRKLYDIGRTYRVLLVCPACPSEDPSTHYVELVETYNELFSREEKLRFTLLRLSPELGFLGISPETIAYFYQSSKVASLFSLEEGEPRVITESLLCGLPQVCYSKLKGAGRDYLNKNNSVQFNDYEESYKALDEAVQMVDNGHQFDTKKLQDELSEAKTIPKLVKELERLYCSFGLAFTPEGIDYSDLNMRLPAHFKDVPWYIPGKVNATIFEEKQKRIFISELLN